MTITGTSFLSPLKGLKSSHLLPIADRVIHRASKKRALLPHHMPSRFHQRLDSPRQQLLKPSKLSRGFFKQPLRQCCPRSPDYLLRPDQPSASTCSRCLCLRRCMQLPSRGCTSLLETSASRDSPDNAVILKLGSSQKCLIFAQRMYKLLPR